LGQTGYGVLFFHQQYHEREADQDIQQWRHVWRDFTYIDDVIAGILNILPNPPVPNEHGDRYKIYNIGNNKPEQIMDYFLALEKALGMTAKKEFLPMQPGDVYQTYVDVDDLMRDFDFKPSTPIEVGLQKFVDWYRDYYEI
jgi:UDP-glucuronate 4-epimerase